MTTSIIENEAKTVKGYIISSKEKAELIGKGMSTTGVLRINEISFKLNNHEKKNIDKQNMKLVAEQPDIWNVKIDGVSVSAIEGEY